MLLERLSTLSHPQRMAVFRMLMRRYPDAVPAGEIASALTLKPSTTSVYLAALTRAGLITQTRHATSLRYAVALDAVQDVAHDLIADCCHGRPDMCLTVPPLPKTSTKGPRVLFLCTGNAARSIFAEALLRARTEQSFDVQSAGTDPRTNPDPMALDLLGDAGLPTDQLWSKDLKSAREKTFDFVITVCDRAANRDDATWPGLPIRSHWGIPDPAQTTTSDTARRAAFQAAFDAMSRRVAAFAPLPFTHANRAALQRHVDDIGRMTETP